MPAPWQEVPWHEVLAAACAALAASYALWRRSRGEVARPGVSAALSELLRAGRRKLLSDVLDVGGFFGADIGGSLTKLVFFLPDDALLDRLLAGKQQQRLQQLLQRQQRQYSPPPRQEGGDDVGAPGGGGGGGGGGGYGSHWPAMAAALRGCARFILGRERYGATGVRDAGLAFHLRELGGTFHFVRFETRRMEGALTLARAQGLGAGMRRLCATGGGAYRFAAAARDTLGVTLQSVDEIDCLVKGMAFLIGYVPAEAYTFHGRCVVRGRAGGRAGGRADVADVCPVAAHTPP